MEDQTRDREKRGAADFGKGRPHMNRKTYFLGSFLVLLVMSSFNSTVLGMFTSQASNINNAFVAAEVFPSGSPSASPTATASATPSATPTATPTSTPTATPTPSPTPSPSGIVIINNGAGSTNTVTVNTSSDCTITQGNSTSINTVINSEANTGGNSISGNTGGTTTIQNGDASSTVSVTVNGGSSSSSGCP